MTEYKDYPFAECAIAADKIVKEGGTVYQKWTCDGCRKRITGNEPNMFTALGHCEECGHTTNIEAKGCNYMVHFVIN